MTASTSPITLPGRHRDDEPIWAVHHAFALLGYAAALVAWALIFRGQLLGRRLARAPRRTHISFVVAALALAVVAVGAALVR